MPTLPETTQKITTISSYDWETCATTYNAPAMDRAQIWRVALSQATEAARRRFPHSNERIERAYALVQESKVTLHPATRTASVTSSDGARVYTVNGTCDCPDATRAPEGACKHVLATCILKKATVLVKTLSQASAPVTITPAPLDPEEEEPAHETPQTLPVLEPVTPPADAPAPVLQAEVVPDVPRIPREFLYDRKGTTAIRWGGLLHMAHEAGLCAMSVEPVTVTPEWAVMRATARFNDGGEWSDIGDATPATVGKEIAPHFIRMASTRAMARVLRIALDIPYVCSVELDGD